MIKASYGILLFLIVAILIGAYSVWTNTMQMKKPISPIEKSSIEKVVTSTKHLIGTNVVEIERMKPDRVRVRTKSNTGNGGDLIELEKSNGEWLIKRSGAWLE